MGCQPLCGSLYALRMAGNPLVAVMMGSKSDWEVMRSAREILDRFEVAHEVRVLSAHRTPHETAEYAAGAEARGIRAIIAAAGGARIWRVS